LKEKNQELSLELERKQNQINDIQSEVKTMLTKFYGIYEDVEKRFTGEDRKLAESDPFLRRSDIKRSIKSDQNNSEDKKDSLSKKGIFLQDKGWKIVYALMLGIEMSIESCKSIIKSPKITLHDYQSKNVWGITHMLLNGYRKVSFIEYAPKIFNKIRRLDGVTNEEYLQSLGPDSISQVFSGKIKSLSGIATFGNSGSFFYYSDDRKYIVKTIRLREKNQIMAH
jgi:hypothetical protein